MLQIGSADHRSRKGSPHDIVIPCHYVATIRAACIITINGLTRARLSHRRRRYAPQFKVARNYINKPRTNLSKLRGGARVHCSETPELMSAAAGYRVLHLLARPRSFAERENRSLSRRLKNSTNTAVGRFVSVAIAIERTRMMRRNKRSFARAYNGRGGI